MWLVVVILGFLLICLGYVVGLRVSEISLEARERAVSWERRQRGEAVRGRSQHDDC